MEQASSQTEKAYNIKIGRTCELRYELFRKLASSYAEKLFFAEICKLMIKKKLASLNEIIHKACKLTDEEAQ